MAFINIFAFPDNVQFELEKANLLEAKKILSLSDVEMKKICNLTCTEIKMVKLQAAHTFHPHPFIRASDINSFEDERKITFDCEVINDFLRGGIRVKGITELAGESGVGKTQLCLQACITVQYPVECGGLSKGAVYICTESKFPSNRLYQLLKHFPRNRFAKEALSEVNLGDFIYVDHIADFVGLKECVYQKLPKLLNSCKIGLIIIDSIAAVFRAEYALKDSVQRAKDIREIALQLHRINRLHQIAVICVNQVTDVVDSLLEKVPALGLAWANITTTRLQAFKLHGRRYLQVSSSPDLPTGRCYFHIESDGAHGLVPAT